MHQLITINTIGDIAAPYRNTPIGELLEYHNLGKRHETYQAARLLIGMCMDNRKHLNIPDNYAYIIRSGGGNLRPSEFKVSFAIAVGGVQAIALIGHTNCGMVHLAEKREQFVNGLVENAGWQRETAEEHFMHFAPLFEIGNAVEFVLSETLRIRSRYPKVIVAPLFYKVEDNRLYLIDEKGPRNETSGL